MHGVLAACAVVLLCPLSKTKKTKDMKKHDFMTVPRSKEQPTILTPHTTLPSWGVFVYFLFSYVLQVRKRLIRRGTKKLPPGSFKWWEDMETRAKSGWLSREQLAASEFARRVAIKHGIGVVAALMKKKELVCSTKSSVVIAVIIE